MKVLFAAQLVAVVITWSATAFAAKDPYQPDISDALFAQVSQAHEARTNNNPGVAINQLESVVQSNPKYFLARYNLGLAYETVQRIQDAITQLEAARRLNIDLHLGEPTIYNSLGSLYLTAGRYSDAVAELQRASSPAVIRKLDTAGRRVVFNNLGLAYSHVKRDCEAGVSYDLAKSVPARPPESLEPDTLSGTWILADWIEQTLTPGSRMRTTTTATGSLAIESPRPDGSFQGNLVLCVSIPATRSFSVLERMSITVDPARHVVHMQGRVLDSSQTWSDDLVTATYSDGSIAGTAGRFDDTVKVSFAKLW